MKISLIIKLGFFASLALAILVVAVIVYSHYAVENRSKNRLFSKASEAPVKKTALVLGCAKILQDGRTNSFFSKRMTAAASLYHEGKCEYLIVSGDNSTKDYDEPTDMQQALIERGVPEDRIYRDFAGFRTLDSVVRAKTIFNQEDIIVVSQPFHNKRAIYLAHKNGMQAVGFNSADVNNIGGLKTHIREYLARVKMMLDLKLFNTQPKYQGPKIELGVTPPPEPT